MESLLPRTLGVESGSDCASLLGALLTGVHLDRRLARSLGWRGVRPAASAAPAWSFRTAGSGHVFGLLFLGETVTASGDGLLGDFDLFVFPNAESALLERFPLEALRLALREDYGRLVRDFSAHAEALAPFVCGRLRLEAALDGSGLGLGLEASARHRLVALDGVSAETPDGRPVWLVDPGEPECDVPQYRLSLPAFSLLAATAERLLRETAKVSLAVAPVPVFGFRAEGKAEPLPGECGRAVRLRADFGRLSPPPGRGRRVPRLPGRHEPAAPQTARLPVLHVLTGFLGAGKTTFLRRWLDFLHGRERFTGVIQNEFGAVGLDARLVAGDTRVEAIDGGCVCCSLADSLRPGLERLLADMPAEQFILETTGLANPENVLESLGELDDLVLPGLVVTVLDAVELCRRPHLLEEWDLLRAQAERADVLVVNKADAVPADALPGVLERVAAVNGRGLLLTARQGTTAFASLDAFYNTWLDRRDRVRMPSRRPSLRPLGQKPPTHAADGYVSRTVSWDRPVSREAIVAVLAGCGPGLCRAKGLVFVHGEGACVVQYAAGRLSFDPAPEPLPDEEGYGHLVLIGIGLRP
ncbi:CobW family GTP-binding protein [Solidesulfovibrio sp.]|uniref:CobW family GTP-binding protein n=1 Tax=Solidesulfovibrio sp. TaxID=2910990 RepID=UPI002B1F3504|nr:CobW family GTP-binding protein [Solidesulfovibrio sp.]MEA5087400.1 CobW family GTP-binding protein [Solidesulfovibrio sp.]HML59598.1 GTP-binding protein [Solidesulfovibrio sp.]